MAEGAEATAAANPRIGTVTRTVEILPNGLPLHRIGLEGTRAVTVVVAFDAGSRTERADEHGAAHFLEHLVFKGGQAYADPGAITSASERLGASLNAYTSHHLVAFHVTARGAVIEDAIDLLTDFVARPKLDASDVERERDVVVQEIARTQDDPARLADQLIDRAAFGDEHPLGREVLGTPASLRTLTRDAVTGFRARQWAGARGGAFLVGNVDSLPADGRLEELFGRFGAVRTPEAPVPVPDPRSAVVVDTRVSNQSHLRLAYRAGIDVGDASQRASLAVLATLLGGSMGSRLFTEIRDRRGLAYLVYAFDNIFADGATLQLSAGLQPAQCVEAYKRMREIVADLAATGPTADEVERARSYAAGQLVIAFESSGAVARHGAKQAVVFGENADHDRSIEILDAVTPESVTEVASMLCAEPAVACLGPHEPGEFS
jgi:predicted Zn-dependent peptidase